MNDTVRIGGRAVLPDGADLVWSVAGGLRGRRWREAVSRGGGVERSLMLEASPVGGPIRLEMTSRGGLLTLHPSSDERELHGNVVTPAGVRHLRFDWSFEHELFVVGSPAAAAVALRRFADIVAVGESRPVPVIWVDDALEPRPGAWQLTRTGPETWSLGDLAGGESTEVRVDVDGVPVLAGGECWALQDD